MKISSLIIVLLTVLVLNVQGKDETGDLASLTAKFHSIINELGKGNVNSNTYEAETAALLKRLEQYQYHGIATHSNISLEWFPGTITDTTTPSSSPPSSGGAGAGAATPSLRVLIVVSSFEGMYLNSGIGTFYAALSEFLVSRGHTVSILYTRTTDGVADTPSSTTTTTTTTTTASKTFARWQASYAKRGISVARLEPSSIHVSAPSLTQKSYQVYQHLKQRQQDFDVVHFPDFEGPGYFSVVAKHQGLAFAAQTFIVGLHGPWRWVKQGNSGVGLTEPVDFETDWLERRSVELADAVVTPSADLPRWLAAQGWPIAHDDGIAGSSSSSSSPASAPRTLSLMPFLPGKEIQMINQRQAGAQSTQAATAAELVFFGRLEARKGVVLFADSLDMLVERRPELRGLKITFLGRSTDIDGQAATKYLGERAASGKWPFKVTYLTHKDRKAALEYIKEDGKGRVAVIPSLIDNAPYTVYECLYSRTPFIASNLPSIAALIRPDDRDSALFSADVAALTSKVEQVLDGGVPLVHGVMSADDAVRSWEAFYAMIASRPRPSPAAAQASLVPTPNPLVSVCITHFNRPELLSMALASVQAQDYPMASIEVVLVDDGSTDKAAIEYIDSLQEMFAQNNWQIVRTENKYLGAARNTAARVARGDYLVFLDDDNLARPAQVSTYVSVAYATGADVVTAAHDVFRGRGLPVAAPPAANVVGRSVPLGPAVALGVFKNCFGDANFFIKRQVFAQTGGFTEERGVGQEDYEFLADAVLSGLHLEAIADPLLDYRMHSESEQMMFASDPVANQVRSARPFKAIMDANPDATSETLTLLARRHSTRYTRGTTAQCNLTVTSLYPTTIVALKRTLITFYAHSMGCDVTDIKIGSYICTNITQEPSNGRFSCWSPKLPIPGIYSVALKYGDATIKLGQKITVEKNATDTTVAALMIKYIAKLSLYSLDALFHLFATLGGFTTSDINLIDDLILLPGEYRRNIEAAESERHDMRFSLSSSSKQETATEAAQRLIAVSLANRKRFLDIGVTILDFNLIGHCDEDTNCHCTPSYTGEGCGDTATCPNNCTEHGNCVDGPYKRVCECLTGFTGRDCSIVTCDNDCNGHGACTLSVDGPGPECTCNKGWKGDSCDEAIPCPNNCSGRGVCNGDCICNAGYGGVDCSKTRDELDRDDNNRGDKADGVTIGMSIAAAVAGILLITAIVLAMYLRRLRQ